VVLKIKVWLEIIRDDLLSLFASFRELLNALLIVLYLVVPIVIGHFAPFNTAWSVGLSLTLYAVPWVFSYLRHTWKRAVWVSEERYKKYLSELPDNKRNSKWRY
jgi:hypothetical protein